jgi:hypothetical protein
MKIFRNFPTKIIFIQSDEKLKMSETLNPALLCSAIAMGDKAKLTRFLRPHVSQERKSTQQHGDGERVRKSWQLEERETQARLG